MPKVTSNNNKNINNIKINIGNVPNSKPKKNRRKGGGAEEQSQAQPPIPYMPPSANQQIHVGVQPYAPRAQEYIPTSQMIQPENASVAPAYFEKAQTNIERTLEDMREAFQSELDDIKIELMGRATNYDHFNQIEQVSRAAQTEFENELRSIGIQNVPRQNNVGVQNTPRQNNVGV